jgi:hypothetical protein
LLGKVENVGVWSFSKLAAPFVRRVDCGSFFSW